MCRYFICSIWSFLVKIYWAVWENFRVIVSKCQSTVGRLVSWRSDERWKIGKLSPYTYTSLQYYICIYFLSLVWEILMKLHVMSNNLIESMVRVLVIDNISYMVLVGHWKRLCRTEWNETLETVKYCRTVYNSFNYQWSWYVEGSLDDPW